MEWGLNNLAFTPGMPVYSWLSDVIGACCYITLWLCQGWRLTLASNVCAVMGLRLTVLENDLSYVFVTNTTTHQRLVGQSEIIQGNIYTEYFMLVLWTDYIFLRNYLLSATLIVAEALLLQGLLTGAYCCDYFSQAKLYLYSNSLNSFHYTLSSPHQPNPPTWILKISTISAALWSSGRLFHKHWA